MQIKDKKQKGFTLIEAMIAVVVFSFGLLGVAGVMLVAVKSNHNGYMRSQANFLAHSIIESMRGNSWAVWNNVYDGTYQGYSAVDGVCTSASPCNCSSVARRDTQKWSNMITNTLTNGSGSISCAASGAYGSYTCGQSDQPYLGLCTVTVTWNESNEKDASSEQSVTIVSGP